MCAMREKRTRERTREERGEDREPRGGELKVVGKHSTHRMRDGRRRTHTGRILTRSMHDDVTSSIHSSPRGDWTHREVVRVRIERTLKRQSLHRQATPGDARRRDVERDALPEFAFGRSRARRRRRRFRRIGGAVSLAEARSGGVSGGGGGEVGRRGVCACLPRRRGLRR